MRAKLRRVNAEEPTLGGDELDNEVRDMDREERQTQTIKIKALRVKKRELEVEQAVAETEKKLKEIKGEVSSTGPAKFEITPQMLQVLATMPDEQREKVVTSAMMMNSRGSGSDNMTMMYLLPMLTGYVKANPASSQADANKTAEIMVNSLRSGFEMARQVNQQPQQQVDVLGIMSKMNDLWGGNLGQRLEVLVSKLQPPSNVFEEIFTKPELFSNVKQFFGGGQAQGISPELQVELEHLRTEREVGITRMTIDQNRWMAEHQASITGDANRIQAVERILAGPLGAMLSQFGSAGASRLQAPGAPQSTQENPAQGSIQLPKQIPGTHLVQCPYDDCGQQFPVAVGMTEFTCPNCHRPLADTELLKSIRAEEEAEAKIREESQARMAPRKEAPKEVPKEEEKKEEPAKQETQAKEKEASEKASQPPTAAAAAEF